VSKNREIDYHMGFVLHARNHKRPLPDEAIDRIMDALIDAVEKEKASLAGGIHVYGSNRNCCEEGINTCRECLEEIVCTKCTPSTELVKDES